ncbi:type II toxin-antitoxin system HicB family antitoxin [Pseudodesulfovibrio sp.]|uniref:type II toxin-antitoxin system HicB family antitoxin n=1 Tax=unclassified Pseudodesulfovibrio TaxID=2661612 RepID=UPI003AFFF925
MATYYAAIFNEEGGGFYAEFPDLEGCFTQAESLEVLDAMLKDALFVWLDASKEEGDDIPAPRSFAEIHNEVAEREDFHSVTLVVIPEKVTRIRKNVSFTEVDLEIIDQAAAKNNMDRSEFLAMAARRVASGTC